MRKHAVLLVWRIQTLGEQSMVLWQPFVSSFQSLGMTHLKTKICEIIMRKRQNLEHLLDISVSFVQMSWVNSGRLSCLHLNLEDTKSADSKGWKWGPLLRIVLGIFAYLGFLCQTHDETCFHYSHNPQTTGRKCTHPYIWWRTGIYQSTLLTLKLDDLRLEICDMCTLNVSYSMI